EITVRSAVGKGSTFTLYLPLLYQPASARVASPVMGGAVTLTVPRLTDGATLREPSREPAALQPLPDGDHEDIKPGDRVLLIVEDARRSAHARRAGAQEKGFRGVLTASGDGVMALAQKYKPVAITLDLMLPDGDGWVVLDRLKHDPATRHVPVQI